MDYMTDVKISFSWKIAFICVVLGVLWYFGKSFVYSIYQKYSAWILTQIAHAIKDGLKDEKKRIFQCLHDDRDQQKNDELNVLDVGSGTAPNVSFLPSNTKLVCVEPNPNFKKNEKTGHALRSLDFVHGYAEKLPFENETFDVLVCTLVLCSVHDVKKSLQEFKRVLKPGGKYIFLEHVGYADKTSWAWMVQCLLNPVQRLLYDGCRLNRDTETYIRAAGFSEVSLKNFLHKPFPIMLKPCISGFATK